MKDTTMETQLYRCDNCGAERQFGTGAPADPNNKPRLKCACGLQTFTFVGLRQGEWTDFKQGALVAA